MTGPLFFERLRDNEDDFKSLFNLKSEPHDVYWSGYISKPDISKFKIWFGEQIERKDREIWLVRVEMDSNLVLGYLYITYSQEDEKRIGWVSHGVSENSTKGGIGTAIVNFAVNMFINDFLMIDEMKAWIMRENIPSIKTFTKNGFIKSAAQKKEFYKSIGKEVILENYSFKRTAKA